MYLISEEIPQNAIVRRRDIAGAAHRYGNAPATAIAAGLSRSVPRHRKLWYRVPL